MVSPASFGSMEEQEGTMERGPVADVVGFGESMSVGRAQGCTERRMCSGHDTHRDGAGKEIS
jgi:hypothetical protein